MKIEISQIVMEDATIRDVRTIKSSNLYIQKIICKRLKQYVKPKDLCDYPKIKKICLLKKNGDFNDRMAITLNS